MYWENPVRMPGNEVATVDAGAEVGSGVQVRLSLRAAFSFGRNPSSTGAMRG